MANDVVVHNCCQIPVGKLLKTGFATGHGYIREPQTIQTAANLCCIAIQSNQNDMFGGQGVATFEYDLAPYVAKSYAKNLRGIIQVLIGADDPLKELLDLCEQKFQSNGSVFCPESQKDIGNYVYYYIKDRTGFALEKAKNMTVKDTFQAMEALVHNLNTMQCLTGDQDVTTLES